VVEIEHRLDLNHHYCAPAVSTSDGCTKNFFVNNHTFTLGAGA